MDTLIILGIILAFILVVLCIIYFCFRNRKGSGDDSKYTFENNPWAIENLQKNFHKKKKLHKIHTPIFYINLDRSIDRKAVMEKQLKAISSNYQRVSAVDGKKIDNKFNDQVDDISFQNGYPNLSFAEIGCTLSHIKAIRMAYDKDYDKALIIEDDLLFYLYPFWENSIEDIANKAPDDWSIIQLYSIKEKCNSEEELFLKYNKNNRCYGTSVYLINRRGMRDILNRSSFSTGYNIIINNNIKNSEGPADYYIYDSTDTYIYTKPIFLVGDDFLPSTIHRDHESMHKNSVNKKLDMYKKLNPNFGNNKISVVIPCIPRDIKFLYRLLDSINNQTYKSYEIIIAMSGLSNINTNDLQQNLNHYYPKLNILLDNVQTKRFASENRNRGASRCTGDIISFMDADDKMYPEKLYYVNKYFNIYDPKILLHSWSKGYNEYKKPSLYPKVLNGIQIYDTILKKDGKIINSDRPASEWWVIAPAHHGHVSIDRKVFDQVKYREGEKYKRGEDSMFIRDVINNYGRKVNTALFVDIPLSQYIPAKQQN